MTGPWQAVHYRWRPGEWLGFLGHEDQSIPRQSYLHQKMLPTRPLQHLSRHCTGSKALCCLKWSCWASQAQWSPLYQSCLWVCQIRVSNPSMHPQRQLCKVVPCQGWCIVPSFSKQLDFIYLWPASLRARVRSVRKRGLEGQCKRAIHAIAWHPNSPSATLGLCYLIAPLKANFLSLKSNNHDLPLYGPD